MSKPVQYQVYAVDGPVFPFQHHDIAKLARDVAEHVSGYVRQGYYRDGHGRALTLDEYISTIRVKELDARMTPEKAYVQYIQDNLERIGADWQPISYDEFQCSEELSCYLMEDLDQEDEVP